jgi:hypothetical protein
MTGDRVPEDVLLNMCTLVCCCLLYIYIREKAEHTMCWGVHRGHGADNYHEIKSKQMSRFEWLAETLALSSSSGLKPLSTGVCFNSFCTQQKSTGL